MGIVRHKVVLHAPARAAVVSDRTLESIGDDHLQTLVSSAFEAGRAEGLAASRESGEVALTEASARLDEAREKAESELPRLTIELAVEIARQLLKVELDAGHYDLERIVRGALSDSEVGRGECIVHLAPEDAARLETVTWRAGTRVEADPSMPRGDVHVMTPRGLLVRELLPALDAIREQLWEELA